MNKEYKKYKIRFLICLVVLVLTIVSFIISMVCVEGIENNPAIQLCHASIFATGVLVGAISLANMWNNKIFVFEPEMYKYYPEDKSKLYINEVLGYMHDILILQIFYGLFVFVWFVFFVTAILFLFVYEETTIVMAVGVNLILITVLVLVSGFFWLLWRTTRNNEAKNTLDRNTKNYMNVGTTDFLGVIQQDLYKGIRFRSKRLILTEQFILGTIDRYSLSPIAIPVCLVQNIRYEVFYHGGSTGKRYKDIKFYFDLTNGNTVLLYISYVECEIVAQMFKYYGLPISLR